MEQDGGGHADDPVERFLEGLDGWDATGLRQALSLPVDALAVVWPDRAWEDFTDKVENAPNGIAALRAMCQQRPASEQQLPVTDELAQVAAGASRLVAEVETLRVMQRAARLALNPSERSVMELVAAALIAIDVYNCGDDPAEGLDDVCPICRLKKALRSFGNGGST